MSESCNHDCASCGQQDCGVRQLVPLSDVKIGKIIGVLSGKGGVGKSMVTALLAKELGDKGYRVGIMDADITGPSIPKMFGLGRELFGDEEGIFPAETASGIKAVSINMMLESDDTPVLWRGPILGGVINQFWSDVIWGDIDVMFVDMPPGTGDVPLTVFQSLHVDGVVVATSPQQLVGLVVEKAVNMAEMMQIPVLGFVENMSVFKCPQCGAVHEIYGPGATDALAARHAGRPVCKLPIDPAFARASDSGAIESLDCHELDPLLDAIAKL